MTLTALAKALGIDRRLVARDGKRGMPVDDVEKAKAWRAQFVRPRAAKRDTGGTGGTNGHAPVQPFSSPYQDARTRWAIAEANERELSVLERKAVLVHRDKLRSEVARILVGLRQSILQVPARLQSVLAAESDEAKVHDILQDELTAVLQQITDQVAT